MSTIQAVVLAIVEGLTEFMPISSTAHLVMVSSMMGIGKEDFTQFFTVAVQLGAILAVVVLYWRKFLNIQRWQFYVKLIIAVIPALVLGYKFGDAIKLALINPTIIALALIGGGVILLFIDNFFRNGPIKEEKQVTYLNSIMIGLFQCLALIPGISRAAATIIGGMQQKLSRGMAAEFSFFLAVPTMAAATGYKLLEAMKTSPEMFSDAGNMKSLIIGNIVAFVVAFFTMKFFVDFVKKHGFRYFGWYRIVIGIVFIILIKMNQIR